MKLTWFGGSALRIQIGGRILLCDADQADASYDPVELVSGADESFGRNDALPRIDPLRWQQRAAAPPIHDTGAAEDVRVYDAGKGATLIDATGEPPLLILGSPIKLGPRWAAQAVVITDSAVVAASVLGPASPRLIALAAPQREIDLVFQTLSKRLGGTSLVALEPGMALEV